jgi:hypothetical protein
MPSSAHYLQQRMQNEVSTTTEDEKKLQTPCSPRPLQTCWPRCAVQLAAAAAELFCRGRTIWPRTPGRGTPLSMQTLTLACGTARSKCLAALRDGMRSTARMTPFFRVQPVLSHVRKRKRPFSHRDADLLLETVSRGHGPAA